MGQSEMQMTKPVRDLADTASARIVTAIADAAEVLTSLAPDLVESRADCDWLKRVLPVSSRCCCSRLSVSPSDSLYTPLLTLLNKKGQQAMRVRNHWLSYEIIINLLLQVIKMSTSKYSL